MQSLKKIHAWAQMKVPLSTYQDDNKHPIFKIVLRLIILKLTWFDSKINKLHIKTRLKATHHLKKS